MANLTRYERFSWDYERLNPLDERTSAWYRGLAGTMDGPVLELACGTGRLVAALAEDGHDVVGLDLTPAMLDHAKTRVAALPPDTAARIRLVQGDMRGFDLPERFGLVIVADNSLREVETREGILACLRCVRRHLSETGRLVVTDRRFDPSLFDAGGVREWPWTEPLPDPSTGGTVQRRVRLAYDADASRLHVVLTYRTIAPDGAASDEDLAFDSPVFDLPDYLALFEEAGFVAEVFSGYGEHLDEGHDATICFVARSA